MLIHGFGDGAYVWSDLVRNLPADYRAFAVDLRGHGNSPRSANGEYFTHQHVADIIETLDSLRLDRLVLVGHSLGADVAMRIAIAQPERIAALVVVDFGMEPSQAAIRIMKNLWHSMRVYATTEEYRQWLTRIRPLVSTELLKHCAAEALEGSEETGFTLRVDPAVFSRLNNPRNSKLEWAMLQRIRCPTLILRGANSAVLSKTVAEKMAAAVPNCTLLEIEKSGHAIMLENPAAFREHVCEFLIQVRERVCTRYRDGAPGRDPACRWTTV